MLPMEAFSSSTEGAVTTWSAGSGLILILNFFRWSSSSSDSSEEKKADFLGASSSRVSRKASCPSSDSHSTWNKKIKRRLMSRYCVRAVCLLNAATAAIMNGMRALCF